MLKKLEKVKISLTSNQITQYFVDLNMDIRGAEEGLQPRLIFGWVNSQLLITFSRNHRKLFSFEDAFN